MSKRESNSKGSLFKETISFCGLLWERKKKEGYNSSVCTGEDPDASSPKTLKSSSTPKVRTPSEKDTEDSTFNSYSKHPLALYLWSGKQQNSYRFCHTVTNGFSSLACSALKKFF